MNNWEATLTEAFDMVHMEQELKRSVREAVREAGPSPVISQWKKAAVVLCLLVLLVTGFGGYRFLQPVSIISIDINPSLELGINAFDRVVSVDAYNDDGEALMQSLPLRFLKSEEAVQTVLNSDVVQSCLAREEALSLTVVGEEKENAALLEKLEAAVGDTRTVYCHSTSAQAVEAAHPCGLSYGKYLAYLEAQAVQPELQPEDVQDMTMKEIHAISGGHGSHGSGHHTPPVSREPVPEETVQATEEAAVAARSSHHSSQKKQHHKGHH